MPLPNAGTLRQRFITSRQLLPGDWANSVTDSLSSTQSLTASTTQTQAAGTKITAAAVVVTSANNGDAVTLPKGFAGLEIFIGNVSANTIGVFPAVGDIIWGSAGNAANAVLAQTGSKNALYKCIDVTAAGVATWYRNLSA